MDVRFAALCEIVPVTRPPEADNPAGSPLTEMLTLSLSGSEAEKVTLMP